MIFKEYTSPVRLVLNYSIDTVRDTLNHLYLFTRHRETLFIQHSIQLIVFIIDTLCTGQENQVRLN